MVRMVGPVVRLDEYSGTGGTVGVLAEGRGRLNCVPRGGRTGVRDAEGNELRGVFAGRISPHVNHESRPTCPPRRPTNRPESADSRAGRQRRNRLAAVSALLGAPVALVVAL